MIATNMTLRFLMNRTFVLSLILSAAILACTNVQAAVSIHGLNPSALNLSRSSESRLNGETLRVNTTLHEPEKNKASSSHPFYRPAVDKYSVRHPIFRPGIDGFRIRTLDNACSASDLISITETHTQTKQNATCSSSNIT